MFATNLSPQIITLREEHLDEAVDVLAQAFHTYPLMGYWFADLSAAYSRALQKMFYFTCQLRLDLDYPLLGSVDATGKLMGVAAVTPPEHKPWTATVTEAYERVQSFVGPAASERMEQYAQLVDTHPLPQPHYYLSVLGVHPEGRGQGHARLLLDAVHALAAKDPTAVGVGLSTEHPINVPMYEHFGYQVVARDKLGRVDVWGMFRPNDVTRYAF